MVNGIGQYGTLVVVERASGVAYRLKKWLDDKILQDYNTREKNFEVKLHMNKITKNHYYTQIKL